MTVTGISRDDADHQHRGGLGAKRVSAEKGAEVWVKQLKDGSTAIGLFNRGKTCATVTVNWSDAGLGAKQTLRDVWKHKDIGLVDQTYSSQAPSHGVVLLHATPSP